jgi:hypothetical protein
MTGLFARVRAWLGGLFDGGTADDATGTTSADESSSRVVHRDDRPLETPNTMAHPDPPSTASREGESPDAGTGAPNAAEATVSIPDAEATDGAERAAGEADPEAGAHTDSEPAAARDDGTVACSVCGTTVDDPSEPCPLCRSTDVEPVADAADAGAEDADAKAFTRGGRTAVSTADDEAVDRLRDVRDGE